MREARTARPLTTLAALAALAAVAAIAPHGALAAEARVTAPSAHAGSWGLEIAIGKDCSAADDLVLDAGSGPIAGLHEACLEVVALEVEIAPAGAVLRAGRQVSLGEGFSVPPGVELTAEIVPPMGSDFASIVDPSPIAENAYRAHYSLDRGGLTLAPGDEIEHFTAYDPGGEKVFRLVLQPDGAGGAELRLAARQDGGGWIETAAGQEIVVPSGWTQMEVSWAAGDGTGELRVAVAGGPLTGLTDLDNDAYVVDSVRWGAIAGAVAGSAGILRLDAFNSWR